MASLSRLDDWKLTGCLRWNQGYEVSDEELQLSLNDFRNKYADPMGYPEYVILELQRFRMKECR